MGFGFSTDHRVNLVGALYRAGSIAQNVTTLSLSWDKANQVAYLGGFKDEYIQGEW